ncbi:MAG: hypothetical protein US22_C0026G0005 [candidate division TM6 bacterium GW2011_GWF2_36_6]|jgi:hypothetical protein|nr:MAG: hypothetical protein US22_C0026G0005 [candidate division TM6 bacterium GW2011_GWF2_36_6]
MGYLERRDMKFVKNIFASVFLGTLNLLAMERQDMPDVYVSQLETQSFGHRIRVSNQSGIRLLIKVCRNDDQKWESILENNSSVDIGSVMDIPKSVKYSAYGNILSWVRMACHGTILLDQINSFKEIAEDMAVIVRINNGNDIQIYSERCRKNVILPKLFPSIELYLMPGYIQGPCYRSIEEFKEMDCINFARYILGIKSDYSECDVNIKANRLLEEWNPELYQEREREIVQSMRSYIEWSKISLLGLLEFTISTREQIMRMPYQSRNEIIKCIVEGSAQQREKLKILVAQAQAVLIPPPPPAPESLPIPIERSHAYAHLDQGSVFMGSPKLCAGASQMQSQVIRPEVPQINPSDLSEMSKSLRRASVSGSSPKIVLRGVQEILPERWAEIAQNPELITHNELMFIRLKYESDEQDSTFLLKLKIFVGHVSDLDKLDRLLNFLDRSEKSLTIKREIILRKISARLGRDALARDIKSGPKLKKMS